MAALDLAVLALYLIGLLAMGAVFVRRVKTSGQMFAAGGESPWWVSGLSAFMTLFSAATFVVWGGIAYRHGLVGVSILFSVGVGTLLVGWLLAGRWRELGVESAAEFLRLRFGPSLVQFYTWLQGTLGLFTLGGGLYALAVIVCAIVPLPEGHPLADPATGRLSVTLATLALGSLVVLITLGGGLWAVLMTDVLQFIILSASVIVVVPLLFLEVGGPAAFVAASPEGFFSPVAADFTWWFLAGWCLVHFFKLGGEWAFVQRYLCVPSRRDARKAAWLFGVLFLVSPFFWMLPPMIYRGLVPDANHEQAYILACRLVLPAGMMGLMIAAMSSATASTLTTQLNVYAAAMTREVYQRYFRPLAPEAELVWAGRAFTFLLGGVVLAGALLIPRLGDYTGYIIAFTTLLTGPLVLPTIWGLFSRRIGLGAVWTTTVVGVVAGLAAKFGLAPGGFLADLPGFGGLAAAAQINPRVTDLVAGLAPPLLILGAAELVARGEAPGWRRIAARRAEESTRSAPRASTLPLKLCAISVAALALLMAVLSALAPQDARVLAPFTALLALLAAALFWAARRAAA